MRIASQIVVQWAVALRDEAIRVRRGEAAAGQWGREGRGGEGGKVGEGGEGGTEKGVSECECEWQGYIILQETKGDEAGRLLCECQVKD